MCGENLWDKPTVMSQFGSSPRVWGKRPQRPGWRHVLRFIPTCVGKTLDILSKIDRQLRFIPTCVGKTLSASFILSRTSGSSPRVWGKRMAYSTRLRSITVHPHVCGENDCRRDNSLINRGSSPRVWGKRSSVRRAWMLVMRFIPTCVGKTTL